RKPLTEPLRCADGVHALTYSADGKYLLVASHDGTARVWQPTPQGRLSRLHRTESRIERIAFSMQGALVRYSPDASRQVLYGGERTVLRDPDGKNSVELEAGSATQWTHFAPDGKSVLTQDAAGELRWFDAASGKLLGPVLKRGPIKNTDLSADGRRLLTV